MQFVYNNYLIYQIFLHCMLLAAQLVFQGRASCDCGGNRQPVQRDQEHTHCASQTAHVPSWGFTLWIFVQQEKSEILHRLHVSKGRVEIPIRTRSG